MFQFTRPAEMSVLRKRSGEAVDASTIKTSLSLVHIDPRDADFAFALVLASGDFVLAGDEHEFIIGAYGTL